MKHLFKFINLNSTEKVLLCQSLIILLLIRLGLFLFTFAQLKHIIEQIPLVIFPRQKLSILSREKIAWAVTIVSNFPPPAKCLARALTTQLLLGVSGYQSHLLIGVAKNPQGDLDSHAWVESDGKIIIGNSPHLSRYQIFQIFS